MYPVGHTSMDFATQDQFNKMKVKKNTKSWRNPPQSFQFLVETFLYIFALPVEMIAENVSSKRIAVTAGFIVVGVLLVEP